MRNRARQPIARALSGAGVSNIGGKGYGERTSVLVMRCLANLTTAKLPLPMVRSMS